MLAKLMVYQVRYCGYYEHAEKTPEFCDLGNCLGNVHDWIRNGHPRFDTTKTFNGSADGTWLPVYCFDVARHGANDFLVTTWNQTPSDDGAVGAVDPGQRAGEANVTTRNFPAGSITGYPTHFWFLPEKSRVVTVRFEHQPLNGHAGMNAYLQGYLERFSPHVRFETPENDGNMLIRKIAGYAADSDTVEADDSLRPRFQSSPLKKKGQLAYIRRHRSKITHVIRKGHPTDGGAATRNLIDRMLAFVGGTPNNRAIPDTNFIFEIPYTPNETELDNIIARWESRDQESWEDVGFDFSKDFTRRWLSSATLKVELDLPDNLHDGAGSVAPAARLLAALRDHRTAVTA